MDHAHDNLVIALISFFGVALTAGSGVIVALLRQQHGRIKSINDSVNHKHTRIPEDHPLAVKNGTAPGVMDFLIDSHDRIVRIETHLDDMREWRDSYDGLPWSHGPGAKEWLKGFENWQKRVEKRLEKSE